MKGFKAFDSRVEEVERRAEAHPGAAVRKWDPSFTE